MAEEKVILRVYENNKFKGAFSFNSKDAANDFMKKNEGIYKCVNSQGISLYQRK